MPERVQVKTSRKEQWPFSKSVRLPLLAGKGLSGTVGGIFMTLYQGLGLPLLRLFISVIAPFKAKFRERLRHETAIWEHAKAQLVAEVRPRVWFHAASMGELEQLLPIIERLKDLRPDLCIVTTCTSPSGRNHAARQLPIDHALYLPLDWRSGMRDFIVAIDPLLVIVDRYDLWPSMISELHHRSVPVHLINATMPTSAHWPLMRNFTRRMYRMVRHVTAVSAEDASQLGTLLDRSVDWLPDTRLDRVMQRIERAAGRTSALPEWSGKTLVLGSTWPEDETMMLSAWKTSPRSVWRLVIVPHEPSEETLRSIEQSIPCQRLSKVADGRTSDTPHILVDSVGRLLELYSSATAVYVGGGFGAGVHSLAEPAGFGLPLACGPGIKRSREAATLVATGALRILCNLEQAREWLHTIDDPAFCTDAERAARAYVSSNTGSAEAYLTAILKELPSPVSSE